MSFIFDKPLRKSDIARKFELPERQSKLNTMLREEGLRDEQVYCICRSSDISGFMIGCDYCQEWYHGDCINISEQEASKIKTYFCDKCRKKNASLAIKYKKKRAVHEDHNSKHPSKNKDHKHASMSKHHHNYYHGRTDKRCGECEGCLFKGNCGHCEYCKDMPKFGGPNKLKQQCKKQQCHKYYKLSKKPKTSFIDSNSKKTLENHSVDCSDGKGSILALLANQTLSSPAERTNDAYNSDHLSKKVSEAVIQSNEAITSEKIEKKNSSYCSPVLREVNDYSDNDVWEPNNVKKKREHHEKKQKDRVKKRRKNRLSSSAWKDRGSSDNSDSEYEKSKEMHLPKQCLGPKCIKAATPNSKYCSEQCGLELSKQRIFSVLPQRIREWNMQRCVAEIKDEKQLEKIRKQQKDARAILDQLDEKQQALDKLVERVKGLSVDPHAKEDVDEECEGVLIYCVTCGHEVPVRRAVKHMENCFNKLESQTTFGSVYKTRLEGNTFCEFYNPSTHTYCKRLRIMCPEHYREPQISEHDVCGAPLVRNVFEETEELCRASKKRCLKHYFWEKIRRAEIEMERVRQWMKLDELLEQERNIRVAMANRAGVLALMLHSTYDHQLAEKLQQYHNDHMYSQSDSYFQPQKHQKQIDSGFIHSTNLPPSDKNTITYPIQPSSFTSKDHQYSHSNNQYDQKHHKSYSSKPKLPARSVDSHSTYSRTSGSGRQYSDEQYFKNSSKGSNYYSDHMYTGKYH